VSSAARREEVLLTVKQAAAILGVSVGTLRRWDDTGKFPAKRHPINGYRLYRKNDVSALRAEIGGHLVDRSAK
jgi:excisionase family DNA binding protein